MNAYTLHCPGDVHRTAPPQLIRDTHEGRRYGHLTTWTPEALQAAQTAAWAPPAGGDERPPASGAALGNTPVANPCIWWPGEISPDVFRHLAKRRMADIGFTGHLVIPVVAPW